MNDILERLYYGEVNPSDELNIRRESFREAGRIYDEAEQRFASSLTSSQLEEFEKLKYIKNYYDREYDILNFQKGFQLGMQLILTGLEQKVLEEE